jgi:hypothetical protein
MDHTPFAAPLHGVRYCDDPCAAQIIAARRAAALKPFGGLDRAFLLWTHEPRFDLTRRNKLRIDGVRNPVHAMTAHNGAIYRDCFYYGPSARLDFDERMRAFREKPRRAVLLATYRSNNAPGGFGWPLLVDGHDIDLNRTRQEIALVLQERGACDLYGKGWPAEVRISGNSRDGDWPSAKREILAGYKISIALENTVIPFYVTEKLWDAIEGATLPVYHGAGNNILDVMPRESFIEAAGKSPAEVADQVLAMSDAEMQARYERCLRAYCEISPRSSREAVSQRTIKRLHKIAAAHRRASSSAPATD